MTKRNKWRPARFTGGHGVAYHGGMKPLPKPKTKKTALGATNTEGGRSAQN